MEDTSMEPMPLSFGVLLGYLHRAITQIHAPRQKSNGTRYSLSDAMLAAFSVFFMQCESFLEHQRQMQSRRGKDNAQTLFGLGQIPTMPQLRNILDEIAARQLFGVFEWVYQALGRGGYLKPYHC
jgi:hypothetical protein